LHQEYEETEGKRGNRTGKIGTGNGEGDAEQQRYTECCDESTHEPTFRHDSIVTDNQTYLKWYSERSTREAGDCHGRAALSAYGKPPMCPVAIREDIRLNRK